MALLSKPYSFLDRRSSRNAGPGPLFRVSAYQQGEIAFTPKGADEPVTRPVLRVWIQRLDRPTNAQYYDISSQRLAAQMLGWISQGAHLTMAFRVRAYGRKPSKVLALDAIPLREV
jgi:hypothetical protein